jgi:PKD repeat protein
VDSYAYKFTTPGEYTVTFFASNANYVRQLTTERKIKVIITE